MEGLPCVSPSHRHFLCPQCGAPWGRMPAAPGDIQAPSLCTAPVTSPSVNVCAGEGCWPRSPRATSCALDREGPPLAHVGTRHAAGCCCQNLPSSCQACSRDRDREHWSWAGAHRPREARQPLPNVSPQAASGLVTPSVTFSSLGLGYTYPFCV